MKWNPTRDLPPGLSLQKELNGLRLGLLATAGLSLFLFVTHYLSARSNLFSHPYNSSKAMLIPGAMMVPLEELLQGVFLPFLLCLAILPIWIANHYCYYHQASKSIYLMRRLPDRTLLHRQCLTLPLLGLVLYLVSALLLFGLYVLIYRFATPAPCLPATIWRL